jgi:hypothetical protein
MEEDSSGCVFHGQSEAGSRDERRTERVRERTEVSSGRGTFTPIHPQGFSTQNNPRSSQLFEKETAISIKETD